MIFVNILTAMGATESSTKIVTVEREEDNFIVRLCLLFAFLRFSFLMPVQ